MASNYQLCFRDTNNSMSRTEGTRVADVYVLKQECMYVSSKKIEFIELSNKEAINCIYM